MGLGFWELILILLVALVVFGPARLPEVARTMAKAVRIFQGGMRDLKDALNDAEEAARYPRHRGGDSHPRVPPPGPSNSRDQHAGPDRPNGGPET